jgi:predicted Zn-dependent protease
LRRAGFTGRGATLLVALAFLSACAGLAPDGSVKVTQTGDNPAPTVVPEGTDPEDAVIGLREHPRIIANYGGVYSDRQAEVMLAQIVGRLLAAADQPNAQFTVTILDSAEVNAFALPGGYIYVTRGILALANDTSELAAVLAHEIAHVTLRHARARTNRTRTTELVGAITGVFGGESEEAANQSKLSLAAFSQNQELEADREGIEIAGKAGFDPAAAARFLGVMGRFAKFSAGEAAGNDDFLSSHPSTPDRVQKAVDTATAIFGPVVTAAPDRAGYLAAIDGLSFGDSPQQGAIVGRRFVHPTLKFTFTVPEGYTLQNSQSAVVGVAGDGEAVRFDSADVASTMALDEYLKSGWIAGLVADTVTKATINGIEMASGIAQTEQWSFRVSVMRLDGSVYRFIFAAKADSDRFAAGAEETLRSFRRATSSDLSKVREVVVKVVTARAGDTADTLAKQMAGLAGGTDLFYVINNLYPGDPVQPGGKYKIVVVQ